MFTFQKKYFFSAILLFLVEVFIAIYVHDNFIRPYVGDLLVVILIYCLVKSLVNAPVKYAAVGVLLFAYFVEILQYVNIVSHLGLQHSKLATIIIGNSFSWMDMLAYTSGTGLIILIESKKTILSK